MFTDRHPPRPFMPTPCQEMGLDNLLELLTEGIIRDIATFKLSNADNYLSQLLSLRSTFYKGLATINTLINTTSPINRLPPELLGRIFSLTPRRPLYNLRTPGQWSFGETIVEDLHMLPKVCRYWRELCLATPTLWSTISTIDDDGGNVYSRHSIYLQDQPSLELSIHLDVDIPTTYPRMEGFLLKNSTRIRELHYSGALSAGKLPHFFRSFDASALEKCFLVTSRPNSNARFSRAFHPFFYGGGPRLRALYLRNFSVLPENEFPVLSCLKLCMDFETCFSWSIWDLLKFFHGCPMLEEIHVSGALFTTSHSSHNPHTFNTPVSLPRLRYLSFQYLLGLDVDADFLLSRLVIPSDCHLYFHVPQEFSLNAISPSGLLDSVCRHIPDKSHISHVALWLPDGSSRYDVGMERVFPRGSLRLLFTPPLHSPPGLLHVEGLLQFLRKYPAMFAATMELRIHYNQENLLPRLRIDMMKGLRVALPAIFPNVKLMSTISDGRYRVENLWTCLQFLLPASDASPPAPYAEPVPYPALETLWVMLDNFKKDSAMAQLRRVLTKRAELGFPVRRAIVAYKLPESHTLETDQDGGDVRELLTLDGVVDEVVLMGIPPQERPSEADWMVWYPEKYELPADVRRDWPAWWPSGSS
ncbi:hypothetical protein V8D89_002886 [Ganoderma adspersum]